MFRRTACALTVLTTLVFSQFTFAQVNFGEGEINLRGTLIFEKKFKNARLTVNSGNRAMKSFQLNSGKLSELLKLFKSGTKVEACIDMKEQLDGGKLKADLLKLRPLGPDEAVLVYTGKIKGCPATKGCKEFGKTIESSLLGDSAKLQDQAQDYFGCLP
jgi:hypothetical protein